MSDDKVYTIDLTKLKDKIEQILAIHEKLNSGNAELRDMADLHLLCLQVSEFLIEVSSIFSKKIGTGFLNISEDFQDE